MYTTTTGQMILEELLEEKRIIPKTKNTKMSPTIKKKCM